MVTLTINASAPSSSSCAEGTGCRDLDVSTTFVVRLPAAIAPTIASTRFPHRSSPRSCRSVSCSSGRRPARRRRSSSCQYKVENGQLANAVNVTGNWSQWTSRCRCRRPRRHGSHSYDSRDRSFGTVGEKISSQFAVQAQPPIVIPPTRRRRCPARRRLVESRVGRASNRNAPMPTWPQLEGTRVRSACGC